MHVIVSADNFEKVDAAVSIIEMLITSVTVSFTILLDKLYDLSFMVGLAMV